MIPANNIPANNWAEVTGGATNETKGGLVTHVNPNAVLITLTANNMTAGNYVLRHKNGIFITDPHGVVAYTHNGILPTPNNATVGNCLILVYIGDAHNVG